MKIAIITDNKHRILQGTTMYQSLDTDYIVDKLKSDYTLTTFTHDQIQSENFNRFDAVIFTTSQVYWYKQYVELNIGFLDKDKLIPSYESLLSHENKAYEYMWLKTNTQDPLYFKNYSDLSTFTQDQHTYPLVLKTPNGSSSRGVQICNTNKQAIKFIRSICRKQLISELVMTPLIQWPHHFINTRQNANFIAQECITDYNGDYRVQVMGDKFFVYYRELKAKKQYTSGNGSINHYAINVDTRLLDKALELQNKIKSPHIIFDFIISNDKIHVLEFSAIHTSNVAIDNCPVYYQFDANCTWQKQNVSKDVKREDYYVYAYKYAIESKVGNSNKY